MPTEPDSAPARGLGNRTGSLAKALRVYIQARAELLALDMQEAVQSIVLRVTMLAAALILGLFAWGILVASVIKLIADLSSMDWKYAGLIVAGLHLAFAVTLVWMARGGPPLFEATRNEFEKDKAWLARQEASVNEKQS